MSFLRRVMEMYRSPTKIWPSLRGRIRPFVGLKLALLARWNGTRLFAEGVVRQEHPVVIQGMGTLRIGIGVQLGYTLAGARNHPILLQPRNPDAEIILGTGTQIMNGCEFFAVEKIEVGPRCLIGPGCLFMDSDFHQVHPERRGSPGRAAPIQLGENIWIGAQVTILKGVTVGQDAVIASGSVVTKNVPMGAIVAGNPARVIGSVYA